MAIWFILILGAYLLGSVPAAYLVARMSRKIDLRQYGTGQVGGGNLWRMTSWKLGLSVGIFDFGKGLAMVWAAQLLGLSAAQQIIVGAAAVIGHNWSVFLRFNGGRGVATTVGVVFILPLVNEMTPWVTVVFFTVLAVGSVVLRSSAIPVFLAVASLPLVSWAFESLSVTLGFLVIFVVLAIKRLTAPRVVADVSVSRRQMLLNRFLFDRDIRDRRAWMYRTPVEAILRKEPEQKEG